MDRRIDTDINAPTEQEKKWLAEADEMLEGQQRPTSQQVAWVFAMLYTSLLHFCSFRRLIYNRMGFGVSDYIRLNRAGGLSINNALADEAERIEKAAREFDNSEGEK